MKINPTTDTCPACGSYRPGYPFTEADPCLNCKEKRAMIVDAHRLEFMARNPDFGTHEERASAFRELLAARRVVEAARVRDCVSPRSDRWDALPAALAAYDEATR